MRRGWGGLGVGCDMHCGGGFIRCGAAPGVESSAKCLRWCIFLRDGDSVYLFDYPLA
jgi:hypothetical protein